MQREAAKKLIKDTFERPFDKEQFTRFAKNLLNRVEDATFTYRGNLIFHDFKDQVQSLERIGKYQDAERNKIDILIVQLAKNTSLERARAAQRKFVAKYLKGSRGGELKDAALVAFVSPDEQDWRFSFVKMDYKIKTTEKGRIRVEEDFTPARRYSFLVGTNENSHTAQSRLLPILENTDRNPTLAEIEESFSVEKVTKEFYEQYRKLFDDITEALVTLVNHDKNIKANFEARGVDTINFAKKLLGQIVFLYFLQKKGWFGVARNAAWGTGPKGFLRQLFDKKLSDYDNFFNDILEPLFYEALAVEREADYYSKFKSKIPFLNGGLFDPLNNYDWVETDILLPNELFSNKVKTKQGDIGTGILDVFDRYNFTVKEDEPLEKEVAVDPEMLGKVFENLLEVKDRKSKGTYYTPREIVHYMCQESLINYLATELEGKVSHDDVETLVKHGEAAIENDARVMESGRETKDYRFKLPEAIRENAKVLDNKLADIKVCDPAVGSGAFLVGMMTEITRSRQALTLSVSNPDNRTAYNLKRDAIQNSLHGVDIDPGAVEIAKLRLWLSLIVDEEDYKHIKPLPNLDYKIMQGNSLLEEYEGIKLINEKFFEKQEESAEAQERIRAEQSMLQREYFELHSKGRLTKFKKAELEKQLKSFEVQLKALMKPQTNSQDSLDFDGKSEEQSKAEQLLRLHERFFATYHKREKDELKERIDLLTWELIETTLTQDGKTSKLSEVRRFQETNTRPFFLWRLYFADVFQARQGFDVIIANPPYGAKLSTDEKDVLDQRFRHLSSGTKNSAIYFIYVSDRLMNARGTNAFIVPKSLAYSMGWSNCACAILPGLQKLIDTGKAFENVKLEQVIFIRTNSGERDEYTNGFYDGASVQELAKVNKSTYRKMRVLLCGQTRDEMALIDKVLSQSKQVLSDFVEIERGLNWQALVEKHPGRTPIYRGAQLRPYILKPVTDCVDLNEFPVGEYEYQFRPKILNQLAIAHVQNPYPHFLLQACLDTENRLVFETISCTFAKSADVDLLFLLGYNNSKMFAWLLYKMIYSNAIRSTRYDGQYAGRVPWPPATQSQMREISEVVEKTLSILSTGTLDGDSAKRRVVNTLTKQIDQRVYGLFRLTNHEIDLIEGRMID